MTPFYWFLCSLAGLALVIWLAVTLFRFYNSPDAERYRRLDMQGPFVPLSKQDIEADEKRKTGL
jgi:hypothetical protein